ncbi:MAG: hypothetical protein KH420_05845 [Clostridiales bacterium]|nr:hypothetical protein [Clostridiales bacterium]
MAVYTKTLGAVDGQNASNGIKQLSGQMNYLQEASERKFAALEKRIQALEKALKKEAEA